MLSSTAMPSATVATRLVARFKVIPVRPRMPKKATIGSRLGMSAMAPTLSEPNRIERIM